MAQDQQPASTLSKSGDDSDSVWGGSQIASTTIFGVLLGLGFIGKVWWDWERRSSLSSQSSIYIALLFVVPLVLQFAVLRHLTRKNEAPRLGVLYSVTTFGGIAPYFFFWCMYTSFDSPIIAPWWICLCLALCLVFVAVWITWVIAQPQEKGKSLRRQLTQDASRHRLSSAAFFFGVFLCVTYLLTFSFAFDDQNWRRDAAGAVKVQPKDRYLEGLHIVPRLAAGTVTDGGVSTNSTSNAKEVFVISFEEGKAVVKYSPDGPYRNVRQNTPLQNDNNAEIQKIVDAVLSNSINIAERIRISIMGHASETKLKYGSLYLSNLELSGVRGREVYRLLSDILEVNRQSARKIWGTRPDGSSASHEPSENIEWQLTPVSNELIALGTTAPKDAKSLPNKGLSVEIGVEGLPNHVRTREIAAMRDRGATPALLDYIYFTIYTITTTGYGDIMPVSDVAKFLVSIANILEVFFLVIFFNVIVSTRHESVSGPRVVEPPRIIVDR